MIKRKDTTEQSKDKTTWKPPLFDKELHFSVTRRLHYPEPEIKDDWSL